MLKSGCGHRQEESGLLEPLNFPSLPRDRAGAAEVSPCRRNGGSSKLGKARSTQKLQSCGWMLGSPRAGPGQQGQSHPALALGVALLGATGNEVTVPRCGQETSTALSTSSRVCQSTKHSRERAGAPGGYAKAWGC